MAIKDLKIRQGNVDIIVDVVDVGEVREFEKFGRTGRVATAIVKDETGDMKLTLWNENIENVKAGDKVHITNGYVSEWQGEPQLTTGKLGKLEVVGESKETKEEMTKGPDEKEDKKIYKESEKRLEKIEEKLEDKPVDVEEVKDE
jgi:replication factor A1|tara:strand:- start:29803 stop:30237 length:435 start_codon:yes stop_codon:yes gene_type:complete